MITLDLKAYGAKAHHLSRLRAMGVRVPEFVALRADAPLPEVECLDALLRSTLSTARDDDGRYPLAIRSSAVDEDVASGSKAGSYLTLVGTFTVEEAVEAASRVRASGRDTDVGVLLQRFVEPTIAGVVFSLDPLTFARDSWSISWVEGRGEALVSGQVPGHSAVIRQPAGPPPNWPASNDDFARIVQTASLVQDAFDFPVDMEWILDDDGVHFVQARPVVLPRPATVPLAAGGFDQLPHVVLNHPKIALRRTAASRGVRMSRAVVELWSGTAPSIRPTRDLGGQNAIAETEGVSVVLLHPSHIGEKVVREFAPVASTDVEFLTRECRRYAIRRYPGFGDIETTVADVITRGLDEAWVAAAIVQEIYAADATGIVRATPTGYLVEVAQGHFVPKGLVTTSLFVLDREFRVIESRRVPQDAAYHFKNGHVITESPVEGPLPLTDDHISQAIMQLAPMFEFYPDAALEFGVVLSGRGVTAYLIDAAEADLKQITTRSSLFANGVISPGRAVGETVSVPQGTSTDGQDPHIDFHLLELFSSTDSLTGTVFVAERASVDLLPLVYRAGSNCAFVFRHASLLAHLAVVMRERNVPAIVVDDIVFESLRPGMRVRVDAVSAGLPAGERLRRLG